MHNLKFNGVLEEIKEQYPNIDIIQFLQRETSASRLQSRGIGCQNRKRILPKNNKQIEQKSVRTILQKTNKSEPH